MKHFLHVFLLFFLTTNAFSKESANPNLPTNKEVVLKQLFEKQTQTHTVENSKAIKTLIESMKVQDVEQEASNAINYNIFLDSTITYSSYTASDSVYSEKQVFYDSLNPNYYRLLTWNSATNSWDNYAQYKREYDNEFENITYYSSSYWDDSTETWVPKHKGIFTYDSNGYWLTDTYYKWNSSTEQWDDWCKYEYSDHDSLGNFALLIDYEWDSQNSVWDTNYNKYKWTYSFDEAGNDTLSICCTWDSYSESWVNSQKNIYKYDVSGNKIFYQYSYWSETENDWCIRTTREYEYNDANLLVSSNWNNTYLYEYKYDSLENKSLYIYSVWDSASSDFKLDERTFYYYTITEVIVDNNGASVATTKTGQVKVYPNPTNGLIYFDDQYSEIKQLSVYNISGKMVLELSSSFQNGVDLSNLSGSIFFLKIETNNSVNVVKVLKR